MTRFRNLFCLAAALGALTTILLTEPAHGFSASSNKAQPKTTTTPTGKRGNDAFLLKRFSSTDIDDGNHPPSLSIIVRSLQQLTTQGSDIRGRFVDHARVGPMAKAAQAIGESDTDGIPALTPLASFFLGNAFAQLVLQQQEQEKKGDGITIAIGTDPRSHGPALCDAFGRGALSADSSVRVVFTGIATTPSCFHFCRAGLCDGAVMVTASHLPGDRNGFKMYTKNGGFTKHDILAMKDLATEYAQQWHDREGVVPPTSGGEGVFCSEWVDFMPQYAATLKDAILAEVQSDSEKPLEGLKIVLNSGHGSGGFFNQVLQDLGADVSASLHVEPNSEFPAGVPNPESAKMMETTTKVCQEVGADLGIMLDTDADRSGFVVPRQSKDGTTTYEPLNRNRLIALLSVIFSRTSPGCAIVTDSVTSEGLSKFIEDDLGLEHVRYLKGYANVINKAKELTNLGVANAEMAIETSGHCAMQENDYLDDGTYTAVKVIGLLAREKKENPNSASLLDLISALEEMSEDVELRMNLLDGSLASTASTFDLAALEIDELCQSSNDHTTLDSDNLEGVRVRTGKGGFFMLRKSLHDPLISLQIEARSHEEARETVVKPLLERFQAQENIRNVLDMKALENY